MQSHAHRQSTPGSSSPRVSPRCVRPHYPHAAYLSSYATTHSALYSSPYFLPDARAGRSAQSMSDPRGRNRVTIKSRSTCRTIREREAPYHDDNHLQRDCQLPTDLFVDCYSYCFLLTTHLESIPPIPTNTTPGGRVNTDRVRTYDHLEVFSRSALQPRARL